MLDINFELYKVFYYVSTTLSFSEASKRLYISQSAVSQSIKLLEKRLNQSLFVRSTKKVSLTPEGEVLLHHIQPAVNLIMRGESQLLEVNSLEGGQLRIGASDTLCRYFLVPYLNRFHHLYPHVHLKVTNRSSQACCDLLSHGQVELIITNYPNPPLFGLSTVTTLKPFRDVFLANRKFFPCPENPLSLADLSTYPLLMLDRKSVSGQSLVHLFRQNHLELMPEIELNSNDLLVDLARIGLGVAYIPEYCVPADDPDLYCIPMQNEIPERKIVTAYSEDSPLSAAAKRFLDLLKEEIPSPESF